MASSSSAPLEPALQERWREGAEVKLMKQNLAWESVPPPTTEDTTEAVIVKNFETALIQRSGQVSQQ